MITLILYVALIGLIAWAVTYFIPMPEKIKVGIGVLAGIAVLFLVLRAFGVPVPAVR